MQRPLQRLRIALPRLLQRQRRIEEFPRAQLRLARLDAGDVGPRHRLGREFAPGDARGQLARG